MKMPFDGEIIYYTLGTDSNRPGEARPAIVVRVWSETVVNLLVFLDGDNDQFINADGWYKIPSCLLWKTSVIHEEDAGQHNRWHRPSEV